MKNITQLRKPRKTFKKGSGCIEQDAKNKILAEMYSAIEAIMQTESIYEEQGPKF